jgi:methyl-branched lipid omega-hydroxylase
MGHHAQRTLDLGVVEHDTTLPVSAMLTDMSVADIDLSAPEFWAKSDAERDAAFARLRAEAPISFFAEPEYEGFAPGPGYWSLTRYADVWHVSRHPELFQSGKGVNVADMPVEAAEFFGSMIAMDAPRHSQLRGLVQRGFTPKHIKQIDEYIDIKAKEIVDRVAPMGACDFVTEIAAQLPLQIICDMLGIPASQHQRIFELTNIILGVGDPEYATSMEELMGAAMELYQYAFSLGEERLKDPQDDITSSLMHAELDGQRLSAQEFGSFFILLTAAGNETTRNAISHGMKALTDFPDQPTSTAWRPPRWTRSCAGRRPSSTSAARRRRTPRSEGSRSRKARRS